MRVALAVTAAAVLGGARNGWILVVLLLAAFVVSVSVRHLWTLARRASDDLRSLPGGALRLMRNDPGYWGGQIAHIGVAVVALGIALSSNLSVEDQIRFEPGQTGDFAGFELTYREPFRRLEPNREVFGARMEIRQGDSRWEMEPRLNNYVQSRQAIATPSVDVKLRGDLYLSLTSINEEGATLDVFWFPYIGLIWLGGGLMVGGGAWAWLVRKPRRDVAIRERVAVYRV